LKILHDQHKYAVFPIAQRPTVQRWNEKCSP